MLLALREDNVHPWAASTAAAASEAACIAACPAAAQTAPPPVQALHSIGTPVTELLKRQNKLLLVSLTFIIKLMKRQKEEFLRDPLSAVWPC